MNATRIRRHWIHAVRGLDRFLRSSPQQRNHHTATLNHVAQFLQSS